MNPFTHLFQMMSSDYWTSRQPSALWPHGLPLLGVGGVQGLRTHRWAGVQQAFPTTVPPVSHHGPEEQWGSPGCILDYSLIKPGLTLAKECSQFSYIYTATFFGNAMWGIVLTVACIHDILARLSMTCLARLSPPIDLFKNASVKSPYRSRAVLAHAFNPSIWEAEAGRVLVSFRIARRR